MADTHILPPHWAARFGSGAVYFERRVSLFFLFGFSAGLPLALSFGTLTYWLTRVGTSKGEIGLFTLLTLPYALKFVWAPFMDRLPFPVLSRLLGRRRGWILASQIGVVAAILGVGFSDPVPENLFFCAVMACLIAFFSASQDIVIDAYRVELLEARQQAAGAGAYQIGYRIAMLVSGGGALIIAGFFGYTAAYVSMAALMVVGITTVLLCPEPEIVESDDARMRQAQIDGLLSRRGGLPPKLRQAIAWLYTGAVAPFLEFMTKRGWFAILAFVLFYKFGDALASMLTGPFYLELGFSEVQVGLVSKPVGITATIIGALIGGAMVFRLGVIKSLWICGVFQLVSNLMFVVLAEVGAELWLLGLTVGIENLAGGMGSTTFLAYLSGLCNLSYTATQFALLSSLANVGRTFFAAPAGFLAEAVSWADFFLLTTVAAVPGLALLWVVSRRFSADGEIGRPGEVVPRE